MQWCAQGSSTYEQRHELFLRQRETVEAEMEKLRRVKAMIDFKCWYYETAVADGSEDRIRAMLPDKLPDDIQKLYDLAHE